MKKLTLQEILGNSSTVNKEFQTPTEGQYCDKATRFVVREFAKQTEDSKLVHDLRFVAREIIANANFHGNSEDSSRKITISCLWKSSKEFYFVVGDEGEGFDIEMVKSKNYTGARGSYPFGLGIPSSRQKTELIYNFKDAVVYVGKKI